MQGKRQITDSLMLHQLNWNADYQTDEVQGLSKVKNINILSLFQIRIGLVKIIIYIKSETVKVLNFSAKLNT